MPNNNAPFGFRPLGHMDGAAPTFGLTTFTILSSNANAMFSGDLVRISSVAGFTGTITPYTSAVVAPALGVFWDCQYFSPQVGRTVWSRTFPGSVGSSSPCQARVITDPSMLFIAQASSAAITQASAGYVFDVETSVAGNTATGTSGQSVDSTPSVGSASVAYSSTGGAWPWKFIETYANHSMLNATQLGGDDAANCNLVVVKANAWTQSWLAADST